MIRKLLTGMLLLPFLSVHAQNEMKEINEIKSNVDFLYATGTSSVSAEDAANNARDLIALEIEQWLKEKSSEDAAGYVAKSKENLSQIKTKRGNLYRVFVFVKKEDVLPYDKEEEVMVVDFVEPQNAEPQKAEPQNAESNETIAVVAEPAYSPSVREKILLSLQTFSELNDYINQGRESRDITNVGNYKNLPSSGLCYIFIHNREGNIPAYIKMEGSKFTNMVTGKDDAVTNYKGCGAIWIQLKQE